MEHTPLPWATDDDGKAFGRTIQQEGSFSVIASSINSKANAEFIVKACNSHYELLEALKHAKQMIDIALPQFNWGDSFLQNDAIKLLNEAPISVNAAIKKAEGAQL